MLTTVFTSQKPTITAGALHQEPGRISVVKLNSSGTALSFAAAFGGSAVDIPVYCELDAAGNIFVSGYTNSDDFPITSPAVSDPLHPPANGSQTTFVTKLRADGTGLIYSKRGFPGEFSRGLALDASGNAQIVYSADGGVRVRRYNSDASAVLFDTTTGIHAVPVSSGVRMAIDSAGATTIALQVNRITEPVLHPTQTCGFIAMAANNVAFPSDSGAGFLIRLNGSGTVQQSTWLQGSGSPTFIDLFVQPDRVTIAAGSTLTSNSTPGVVTITPIAEVLTLTPTPGLRFGCIGNGASFVGGPLAGGEIVSLFGEGIGLGFGPPTPVVGNPDASGRYPVTVSGTQVTFDGVAAPLLYVSPSQINAVVPFTVKPTTRVCVSVFFGTNECADVKTAELAPAVFVIPPASETATPFAAAINQNGSINSEQNPAPRGSVVALFATGLGPLSTTPADGTLVGLPLATQNIDISVSIPHPGFHGPEYDNRPAVWAGQAPFQIAGLSQVNVTIPADGDEITLIFSNTGIRSAPVRIWVR